MHRIINRLTFPAKLVVMGALFSAVFLANAGVSQAASAKKKSAEISRTAVEHTESRIKKLETALNITPDQEVVWNDMTQVMRENAIKADAITAARGEKAGTLNAVERMKLHSQLTEAQLDQQRKFIPVFEALYVSLSDAQKTSIDTIFRTGKHRKQAIN